MDSRENFAQLKLRFTDPIQHEYETIRPVVLFGERISQRSQETDIARTTLAEKAKRFLIDGMFGLADQRKNQVGRKGHKYPPAIANYILYLKQIYPPMAYREIVRILARKFGYKTNHHTLKNFLAKNARPVQLELKIETFHEYEDAYQARWAVIRLFIEGWRQKSIAGVLKLSERHVSRLIKAFDEKDLEALEDKRTRPVNHPHNQMTLLFTENVLEVQNEYPRAGRFRVHGILEQKTGEDIPSESTVGRAMAFNRFFRGAPGPWPEQPNKEDQEPKPLPYNPLYPHQYWFIDIRYLVKLKKKWVYSICIIEGYSRKILAGMVSEHQDELAILQLLYAAFSECGCPEAIVSDNGSVFKARAYTQLLQSLNIQPCYIQKRQSWQNLIETQFTVQLRLADDKFEQAKTIEELQEQHGAFIQLFNTTKHWVHRHRQDGNKTPVSVLGWTQGRLIEPDALTQAFRHLQFSRVINQHGCVSVQRFYIYAEHGLAKQRVIIWIYEGRLRIEYQHILLAQYQCQVNRKHRFLQSVSQPKLYQTPFASPQLELLVLDEQQWRKIWHRPPYSPRKSSTSLTKQLPLLKLEPLLLLILFL